jgi:hypothetical protein
MGQTAIGLHFASICTQEVEARCEKMSQPSIFFGPLAYISCLDIRIITIRGQSHDLGDSGRQCFGRWLSVVARHGQRQSSSVRDGFSAAQAGKFAGAEWWGETLFTPYR